MLLLCFYWELHLSDTWLHLNGMLKREFDLSTVRQLCRRLELVVTQKVLSFTRYIGFLDNSQCSLLVWNYCMLQFPNNHDSVFFVFLTFCAIDFSLSPFWKSHKSLTSKVNENSILIKLFSAFKQFQICSWLSEPLCNGLERMMNFLRYCEITHLSADPYWRLWTIAYRDLLRLHIEHEQ